MRRALAVVAAVVLVALGFVVRSWRAGDIGPQPPPPVAAPATVVCATELAAVCAQVKAAHPELTIIPEDAGRTYTTVTGGNFDATTSKIDAWLAPSPWATMADQTRQRNGAPAVFAPNPRIVARSPLVMVIWNDRAESLRARCGDVTWKCVGEVAGTPWSSVDGNAGVRPGDVRPGLVPPANNGIGLLVAGQAASSWFGRTDFASQDYDDDGFRRWLDQISEAAASSGAGTGGRTPLDQMLSLGQATFDLAGTTEAAATGPVRGGRDKDRLSILYPSPSATADLVLTPFTSSTQAERLAELFASASTADLLVAAGWRVADHDPPADVPAGVELPATDGLPRPGVLDALRTRW